MIYQLTDRLHEGHMARVPAHRITAAVFSGWLAELGTHNPLVDDLPARCGSAIGRQRMR